MPKYGRLRPLGKKLFLDRGRGRSGETLFSHLAGAEALREFLNATGGIDKLLLASEKGMAGSANAETKILFGGASVVDGAAGTDNLALRVFGMNIRFHGSREA